MYAGAVAIAGDLLAEAYASAPSSQTNDTRTSDFVFLKQVPVQYEQLTGRYVAVVKIPVTLWEEVLMTPNDVHYASETQPRTHGTRMGYASASFQRMVDIYRAGSVVLLDMGVSLVDGAGWFCDPALCRLHPVTGQTAYSIPFAAVDVPHTGYTRTSAPKEIDDYMGEPLANADGWFGLERICVVIRSTGQDDSSALAQPERDSPVPLVPLWGRVGDPNAAKGPLWPRQREVVVYDANGLSLRFWKTGQQNGVPVYGGAKGVYSKLEEPSPGTFVLRGGPPGAMHAKGNWLYQFSASRDQPRVAYITNITDPLGNAITVTRDATGTVTLTDSVSGSKLRFQYGTVSHQLGNSSTWNNIGSVSSSSISWGGVSFSTNGFSSLTVMGSGGGGYGGPPYGPFWQESWTWTNATLNNQTAPENGLRLGSYRIGSLNPTSYQYTYVERMNGEPRKLRITIQPQGKPSSTLTYYIDDDKDMFSKAEYVCPSLSHAGNERTVYIFDSEGRVVQVQYFRNASDLQPAWTESYAYLPDDANKVTQYVDRGGNLWSFGYTQIGEANLVSNITDPTGVQTQFQYSEAGLPIAIKNGANHTWSFEYLPDGRVLSFSEPSRLPWIYNYYAADHQWRNKVSALWDPTGRVIRITAYDIFGRAKRWEAYPNGEGQPSIWQEVTLNNFGLPTQVRYSDNTSISLNWSGIALSSLTDARQRTVNFLYNQQTALGAAGLLSAIRFGNGQTYASLTYDNFGRLTRVQGGNGVGVSYTYGNRDELRTLQVDGLSAESFDYTCCGRVKRWTKSDGTQIEFSYRPTGELTQIQVNGTPYSSYTYDAAGRLLSASTNGTSLTFSYESTTGRLLQESGTIGSVSYALGYSYLPSGEVETLTASWGSSLQYGYDAAGRLTHIAYNGIPLVHYEYDGAGRVKTPTTYPVGNNNTLQTTISYVDSQSVGAVGLIQHAFNGNLFAQYDYRGAGGTDRGYYTDGTLGKAIEQVSGVSNRVWEWEYNVDGSLQYERLNGATATFAYDAGGNLTSWTGTTWQYAQNRLVGVPSRNWTFTYDANGNRVTANWNGVVNGYAYDPFDNLVVVSGTEGYQAVYDALGRRVWMETSEGAVTLIYDGDTLLAEADTNGVRAMYVWGVLGPVARIDLRNPAGTRYYILDGRGHVRLLLDNQGNITDRYSYDAWGNPIEQVGSTPNPFRWNGAYGYEWIATVGLYHVGARAYDPRTTRWLQKDPIGTSSGDPNLYRYCGNDPINYTDPTGLMPIVPDCPLWLDVPSNLFGGGLLGFGGGLEYALRYQNKPTRTGHVRFGRPNPTRRFGWERTFHIDYHLEHGVHLNADVGFLTRYDHHRLPNWAQRLGEVRVLSKLARGSMVAGLALSIYDVATAPRAQRCRAVGGAIGGAVGSVGGAALGSILLGPGIGTTLGGAIGGMAGSALGQWVGSRF
ncbi:MAG: RHS repeat-associated core domain-containing protein [Chthonomonadetes bacterium]|nr:RHS repeat-associated core domain-containing protein [Chthonomonadetes bacterium]